MQTAEAIRHINGMVFKPGWRVQAVEMLPDLVLVELLIDTVDTSYPDPDGVCRKEVTLYRETYVRPSATASLQELCYAVLKLAADTDIHEDREFLKVRDPATGRWVAPLHPHTPEGNRAWDTYNRGRVRA